MAASAVRIRQLYAPPVGVVASITGVIVAKDNFFDYIAAILGSVGRSRMADDRQIAQLRNVMRFFINEQKQALSTFGQPAQSRMLSWLYRHGPISQAALCRIGAWEKSWISRAVDRLVAQGWVERLPSETDRRGVLLTLTAAGRLQAARINAELDRHAGALLDRVPPTARDTVHDALDILQQVFEAGQAARGES